MIKHTNSTINYLKAIQSWVPQKGEGRIYFPYTFKFD